MNNIAIIVQARMGATRLPGKPLKEVLGKTLLHYLIERLKRVPQAKHLIVATSSTHKDQPIIEECQRIGVSYFRGSEEDVLSRYYEAAAAAQADVIVRITADCPLIDPAVVAKVIHEFVSHYPQYDYVSNTLERTYPRGMDVEVFSFNALEEAHREARLPEEREHVTPFIYRHPERYSIMQMKYLMDLSLYRWTVDTPEDFNLIKKMLEEIYPQNTRFTLEDLVGLLDKHPDWSAINAHVSQKKIS